VAIDEIGDVRVRTRAVREPSLRAVPMPAEETLERIRDVREVLDELDPDGEHGLVVAASHRGEASLSLPSAPGFCEDATMVEAVVRRVWAETPRLKGVLLEVTGAIAGQHAKPGQFIVVHAPNGGTGKVYLVIASRPGNGQAFELLLGESAEKTLGLDTGMKVEIDPPQGAGYPMDVIQGRDVLLFATGSGL